jgi:nucleotide-binding universal stress UspA family protein
MKRFKHIVATTDLSPESFSAVSYAAHLARSQGSKLTVVHVAHSTSLVFTDFAPPIDMVNIDAAIEQAAVEQLDEWVARHLHNVPRVDVTVRRGITHEVICEVAKEVDASVIVIATHGRKGIGHLFLGSVAERVIRDAPCPVLVVKPPADGASAGGGKKKAKAAPRAKKSAARKSKPRSKKSR